MSLYHVCAVNDKTSILIIASVNILVVESGFRIKVNSGALVSVAL